MLDKSVSVPRNVALLVRITTAPWQDEGEIEPHVVEKRVLVPIIRDEALSVRLPVSREHDDALRLIPGGIKSRSRTGGICSKISKGRVRRRDNDASSERSSYLSTRVLPKSLRKSQSKPPGPPTEPKRSARGLGTSFGQSRPGSGST